MKLKTLATLITLSIITTTMTQASIQDNITEVGSTETVQSMTTAQLQIEVEKHSNNESLSFTLGKELIKRWTKS